jgi:branched-chain amino acid transport system permease protein
VIANVKAGTVILLCTLVVLALLPLFDVPQYLISMLTVAMVFVILAASWDFLTGATGQVSFGHAAFFGVGAYGAVLPIVHWGVSPLVAFIVGIGVAAAFGLAVGMVCLRLRGPYLALTTLALAQITHLAVDMTPDITRGALGISGFGGLFSNTSSTGYYYFGIALALVIVIGLRLLLDSKFGLILRTLREDEVKAECIGVDTTSYKVIAFIISSATAGAAGVYYAFVVQVLTPSVFENRFSALPIGMSILGGLGTTVGPAFFALLFYMIGEFLRPLGGAYDLFLLGLLIIMAVMYLPKGLYPLLWRERRAAKKKLTATSPGR